MSLPVDNDRSEADADQHSTDTDSAPRSGGSSTPRFHSCHSQLEFGSCASTFHPPPVVRPEPSSTAALSSPLSTFTATSPKLHAAKMASSSTAAAIDAITAPSPATTADTVQPFSTFSAASTRSPSVSSVSSLRSRASFIPFTNLKNNVSMPPFTIEPAVSASSSHDVNATSFNHPTPSNPVIETKRHVEAASIPPPIEEEMITIPVRIFRAYEQEIRNIQKDHKQLRKQLDRHIDFHKNMVALCEEHNIRVPPAMYAALPRMRPEPDYEDDTFNNASEESTEDSENMY